MSSIYTMTPFCHTILISVSLVIEHYWRHDEDKQGYISEYHYMCSNKLNSKLTLYKKEETIEQQYYNLYTKILTILIYNI